MSTDVQIKPAYAPALSERDTENRRHMDQIREIQIHDAQAFLTLCRQLDEETRYMLLEPHERDMDKLKQEHFIDNLAQRENQTLLLAQDRQELIGFAAIMGGAFKRNAHTASVVLGVLKAHQGKGVGTALLSHARHWAPAHHIKRLELTVMKHNVSALALYEKMGFEFEGVRKKSICVDGSFIDEYAMALLL